MAGKHDFYIDSGTTWNRAITWADANNAPYDITDYTARMHLRVNIDDASPALEMTTENSRIIITGASGLVTLSLTDTLTGGLEGTYFYDLELESPSGEVTRILEGKVFVSKEVTR